MVFFEFFCLTFFGINLKYRKEVPAYGVENRGLRICEAGEGDGGMEVLKAMTAREVLNLIEWLKSKNFTSDEIVDCIEAVEGKKREDEEEKKD